MNCILLSNNMDVIPIVNITTPGGGGRSIYYRVRRCSARPYQYGCEILLSRGGRAHKPETWELVFSDSADRGYWYQILLRLKPEKSFTVVGIPRNRFVPSFSEAWINAVSAYKSIGKDGLIQPKACPSYSCSIYNTEKQLQLASTHCGLCWTYPGIDPGWPPDLDKGDLVGLPHDHGGRKTKMQDGTLVTGVTNDSYWQTAYGFTPPYSTDAADCGNMVGIIRTIPRPSFPQPSYLRGRLIFDAQDGIMCDYEEPVNSKAETNLIDYFSYGENTLVEGVSSQNWGRESSCLVPNHDSPRLRGDGDSARVPNEAWPAQEVMVESPTQETGGDLICTSSVEAVSLPYAGQPRGHVRVCTRVDWDGQIATREDTEVVIGYCSIPIQMGEGDTTQFPPGGRTIPALSVLSTPAVQQGDQPSGDRGATRPSVQPAYIREGLLQQASAIMAESLNPMVVHVHQADWAPNVKFKIGTVIKQDGDLIVLEEQPVTDPADRDRYPEAFVHHHLLQHVKKHASVYAKLVNCGDKELVQRIDDVMQSFPREGTLPPTAEQVITILQISSRFLESVEAGLSRTNEIELCQKVFDGVEKMHQLAQCVQC